MREKQQRLLSSLLSPPHPALHANRLQANVVAEAVMGRRSCKMHRRRHRRRHRHRHRSAGNPATLAVTLLCV